MTQRDIIDLRMLTEQERWLDLAEHYEQIAETEAADDAAILRGHAATARDMATNRVLSAQESLRLRALPFYKSIPKR